jgi:imidazolonepropionase-like amidohydrolase
MRISLASLIVVGVLSADPVPAATTVIHAGHLIAEPGTPVLERQSILIEDGHIVGLKSGFVSGDTIVDLREEYVLPGLIDMHTHLTVELDLDAPDPTYKIARDYYGRPAEAVLKAVAVSRTMLMNGFTTIRNLGDPSSTTYDLRNAIARGWIEGPRIIAVEPQFEVSGGDYHPSRWGERRELEPYFENRGTCSGVEDCRRAVREEIARGADVIKFREGGLPFLDPKVAGIEYPEEVRAIVDTAHKLNRRVAAHVNSTAEGNRLAIEAGVDTIEHGPLDDRAIELMRKHGTAYTPTLLAWKLATPPMQKKMGLKRDLYAESMNSVAKAYRAGVMIVFGTDLGAFPADRVPEEFSELVAAGLPPDQALRAATINAAVKLGMDSSLGSIAVGKVADIVAVSGNPLSDIRQMGRMRFVMKGGQVIKNEHPDTGCGAGIDEPC